MTARVKYTARLDPAAVARLKVAIEGAAAAAALFAETARVQATAAGMAAEFVACLKPAFEGMAAAMTEVCRGLDRSGSPVRAVETCDGLALVRRDVELLRLSVRDRPQVISGSLAALRARFAREE